MADKKLAYTVYNTEGDILDAIAKFGGQEFLYADATLQQDEKIQKAAILRGTLESLSDNPEGNHNRVVVLAAIAAHGAREILYADKTLQEDEKIQDAAIHQGTQTSLSENAEGHDNKAVVLAAITAYSGDELDMAPEELKNDREFVLEAIKLSHEAFKFCSKALQNEYKFQLDALKKNGLVLQYLNKIYEEPKYNYMQELAAINQNPLAMEFVRVREGHIKQYYDLAISAVVHYFNLYGKDTKFGPYKFVNTNDLSEKQKFDLEAAAYGAPILPTDETSRKEKAMAFLTGVLRAENGGRLPEGSYAGAKDLFRDVLGLRAAFTDLG